MSENDTQDQCKRWLALRRQLLADIEQLDKETPWRETEPAWWLEMIRVRDAVINQNV